MTTAEPDLETAIPDLSGIPLDQLGGSALDHAIALYRERLKEGGVPLSSFQAWPADRRMSGLPRSPSTGRR